MDVFLRVVPGGQAEAAIARTLPWSRVVKTVASCDCVTLRPANSSIPPTDGPGLVCLDLAHEPSATKSFAPTIQLLDAAGRELTQVTVEVEIATSSAGGKP